MDIKSVKVLDNRFLLIEFDDGLRVWDTLPMRKGVFDQLNDPDFYHQVRVDEEARTLVWDEDTDIAPESVYANSVPLAAMAYSHFRN